MADTAVTTPLRSPLSPAAGRLAAATRASGARSGWRNCPS
ncbi:hypothetical protein SAFG77S_09997 [Streptomyces afghaniensis]